jgi:hypothetical protein
VWTVKCCYQNCFALVHVLQLRYCEQRWGTVSIATLQGRRPS